VLASIVLEKGKETRSNTGIDLDKKKKMERKNDEKNKRVGVTTVFPAL